MSRRPDSARTCATRSAAKSLTSWSRSGGSMPGASPGRQSARRSRHNGSWRRGRAPVSVIESELAWLGGRDADAPFERRSGPGGELAGRSSYGTAGARSLILDHPAHARRGDVDVRPHRQQVTAKIKVGVVFSGAPVAIDHRVAVLGDHTASSSLPSRGVGPRFIDCHELLQQHTTVNSRLGYSRALAVRLVLVVGSRLLGCRARARAVRFVLVGHLELGCPLEPSP